MLSKKATIVFIAIFALVVGAFIATQTSIPDRVDEIIHGTATPLPPTSTPRPTPTPFPTSVPYEEVILKEAEQFERHFEQKYTWIDIVAVVGRDNGSSPYLQVSVRAAEVPEDESEVDEFLQELAAEEKKLANHLKYKGYSFVLLIQDVTGDLTDPDNLYIRFLSVCDVATEGGLEACSSFPAGDVPYDGNIDLFGRFDKPRRSG